LEDFRFDGATRVSGAVSSLTMQGKQRAFSILKHFYDWLHATRAKADLHHLPFAAQGQGLKTDLDGVLRALENLLRDPPPRFLVGTPTLDPIKTIIHGDLNARNLTWAQAFKRFFIIDFEHTGYGLLGVDQFRLVMSLLSDLWSAASRNLAHSDADLVRLKAINSQIELLFAFLDKLTDSIEQNGFSEQKTFEDDDALRIIKDSFIPQAIIRILSTIRARGDVEHGNQFQVLDKVGDDFWKYVAFCAALKEFEYSLRDLTDELMDVLSTCTARASEQGPVGPGSVLLELHENSLISDDQRRIGARFVCSFCCVVASLPVRTER
jgi:hypothetical protein